MFSEEDYPRYRFPFKSFCIDFDGTIVADNYPAIGLPNMELVEFIRKIQQHGDKWILLTMREDELLDAAIKFLKKFGLKPDAVNDNLKEQTESYGNNPRKIYGDVYIDDHNLGGLDLTHLNKFYIEE